MDNKIMSLLVPNVPTVSYCSGCLLAPRRGGALDAWTCGAPTGPCPLAMPSSCSWGTGADATTCPIVGVMATGPAAEPNAVPVLSSPGSAAFLLRGGGGLGVSGPSNGKANGTPDIPSPFMPAWPSLGCKKKELVPRITCFAFLRCLQGNFG